MSEIEQYRYDFEIIRLTAEQVIKDFGTHGIEINFSGNELTAYQELITQIKPVLLHLYQEDKSAFQSLLYRIDIHEKKFRALLNYSKEEFPERLAELVVHREFQKILLRKYFSGK